MTKFYTGVGSRDTPEDVLSVMRDLSRIYREMGWTLRSGGARGADTAFEENAGDLKEIYLANSDETIDKFSYDKAQRLASMYHPAWLRLPEYSKKLLTRNAFQVMGAKMDNPSDLIICWTKDGCISHYTRDIHTGGTGDMESVFRDCLASVSKKVIGLLPRALFISACVIAMGTWGKMQCPLPYHSLTESSILDKN